VSSVEWNRDWGARSKKPSEGSRFENPNPSQLTPAQIDKEIDLTNISATATSSRIWPKSSDSSGPAPAAKN
jgi:hypothetical protein